MKKLLIIAALFIGLKAQAQVSYVPIQEGVPFTAAYDSAHTRLGQNIDIQIYVNDTLVGYATKGQITVYCTVSSTALMTNNQQATLVNDSVAAYIAEKKWIK